MNKIIQEAGVAKGTVYLYFGSKEEIYLSLLEKYFLQFEESMLEELEKSDKESCIDTMTNSYIKFAQKYPKGVYLASIAPLILENNLSDEYILRFKVTVKSTTTKVVIKLAELLKANDIAQVVSTFLISYNLFLGSWQHCNPPEAVKKVLDKNGLNDIIYNFEKEISTSFKLLWSPYL